MTRHFEIVVLFLVQFLKIQYSDGSGHEKNSFLEYCSTENPGDEKICRDAEAMTEFPDKKLRINGVFIIYNTEKIYEKIVFGWGQCQTRPVGSYIKLLPWAMWQKAPADLPLVIVISETIDLFTSYTNHQGQIPLAGGKTHVFIFNGELRSFRGDIHRRCVAPLPDLHGFTEYHFEDKDGDSFMSKYMLTNKDKIFIGKDETKECAQYAKMDAKRDLFFKNSQANLFPLVMERCKLDCAPTDISIIRARNGTGLVELDEDAGLPGLLVMYAMNETAFKFSENRIYPPTFGGMLTSMYDTEVEVGEFLRARSRIAFDPADRIGPTDASGQPLSQQGRGSTNVKGRRIQRESKLMDDLMENDDGILPQQKRTKRLSYSSAVFMANTLKGGDGGIDEMRCVG